MEKQAAKTCFKCDPIIYMRKKSREGQLVYPVREEMSSFTRYAQKP